MRGSAPSADGPSDRDPSTKQPDPVAPKRAETLAFPVVGLGASAGGLTALEAFFSHVPANIGMAFVVVTHLHPKQRSMMAELLGRKTSMPVVEVTEPTAIQINQVYTCAAGYDLELEQGVLRPLPRSEADRGLHLPVDHFFTSLASDQREGAVGVILSGTGSDGTRGLKEIKSEFGMVMAQDEASAEFRDMPHNAIATDMVDYVLPPAEMPDQLLAFFTAARPDRAPDSPRAATDGESLVPVFALVLEQTGYDFSRYKSSTVRRRIERRMSVHRVETPAAYLHYLRTHGGEIDLLVKELLIGVTSFFRDPASWQALAEQLEQLLSSKPDGYEVRAWVAGCSTGEEAYSLAITLRELLDARDRRFGIQIFATDLDTSAIDAARMGTYPAGIEEDVSSERLERFFVRKRDNYVVKKEIRELIVFAPQNLIADPPFTKLDILCCRNLLIYLDASLQQRLLPMFHYALKPSGLLFLGTSESIGASTELFSNADKKWKIFRRNDVRVGAFTPEFRVDPPIPHVIPTTTVASTRLTNNPNFEQLVDRLLLRELVPPTVLVHEKGSVVHIHGRTGLFLEPAQGSQASANIFGMARPGLETSLATVLRQAFSSNKEVVLRGVRVRSNGESVLVDLRAVRLQEPEALRGLVRLSFEQVPPAEVGVTGAHVGEKPSTVLELERELQYTRESHQSTIEELETANQELKSTNEELQSTNEELQSTNEELETSKEEMQSLNEELQTVNAELQGKVDELSRTNNDMKNLLNGTDIATIFVDNDLRIKRYTEPAKKVIPLIPTDVGRHMGDLVSTLRYDHLVQDASEVLRTLVFNETEVLGDKDECYLMRIIPYRTTENVIDGLVLTFVEVTKLKKLQAEQDRMLRALKGSPVSVFAQDREFRFVWVHSSAFGSPASTLIGRADVDLFTPQEVASLRALEQEVMLSGKPKRQRLELTHGARTRLFDLYVEALRDSEGAIIGTSCVAMELTLPNP